MNSLSHVVRDTIPNYLKNAPVPDSVTGFFHLTLRDWVSLTPLAFFLAGTTYLTYKAFCPVASRATSTSSSSKEKAGNKVNESIQKDKSKVADTVEIEEIGNKKVFCRCWRSKKFPYCDGSHNAHNEATGDNVGPLIITGAKKDA